MTDRAGAVVVIAKQPIAGKVKTRLHTQFTAHEAAELASAALRDTLGAVRRTRAARRVLAWDGDPHGWDEGFTLIRQPAGDLNARLDAAFASTFREVWAADSTTQSRHDSALLIGMDTPQVSSQVLDVDWDGADAVLGLSDDGGFWAIGLRRGRPSGIFSGVPMSTGQTGAAQLARMRGLGLTVKMLPPLLDVDTPDAAERVAYRDPDLQFSRTHARIVAGQDLSGWDLLFDCACLASPAALPWSDPPHALSMNVGRWLRAADEIDLVVLSRCQGPVIDLGCGPGRLVKALTEMGCAALGVDASSVAVAISQQRGAPTLRRDIRKPLPREGRWGTALLMDGNVGIGGDVETLLLRCRSLVVPGGLILCEVDPEPDCHDRYDLTIGAGASTSTPMPWVRIGSRPLCAIGASAYLLPEEEWSTGERCFVALRTPM